MPRGQSSGYRALAHLRSALSVATPKQAKELNSHAQKKKESARMNRILHSSQYISDVTLELGKRLVKYTPAIFKRDDRRGRPDHISSSILLKWGDSHFLVTTGHTIKQHRIEDLGVFFNDTLITIGGQFRTSTLPWEKDKIDIAIVKLDQSFLQEISGHFEFFDLKTFNIDHNDIEGSNYLVVGYPLTKVRIKPSVKKIIIEPFIFRTNSNTNNNKYKKLGFAKHTHLILNYRERRIVDSLRKKKVQGPHPRGLSGCGIWCIPNFVSNNIESIAFFPSGVIIEYYNEETALVGTRIPVITEGIRQIFEPNITPAKKLKVNL